MSLADELDKLSALHERGVLTTEEFQKLKTRLVDGEVDQGQGALTETQLRRSQHDRWLGGVCGGLARLTGTESWLIRLAFSLLFLFWGTGLVVYLLLWIFVPNED